MNLFKKNLNSHLEYNLYINNLNGILQALSINLVTPFASLYAKRLNATDNDIALLNSYPAIFCILAVFLGTYLFRRYKNKKKITTLFFGFGRAFFLVFIFVPFFPAWIQPGIFVLLYGAMNFPNSIATIGWQSYMGDLFSDNWRGRAFSRRSSLSTFSALVITLITGNLLYYIPKNNIERIHLYQLFFGIAFLFALFEIYSFTLHKLDKSNKQVEVVAVLKDEPWTLKVKNIYTMVIKNKPFLDFIICVILFHFAWQMGWALFFSYEVDILHSNESWTSLESTVSFIVQAAAFPLWQKLAEKKGNRFAISWAILLMACCPFFYMISSNMYQVVAFTTVTGFATAGTTLLLLNNLYETSPDENRTVFIAVYTILTNITLMFAPIVGMKLKSLTNIWTALCVVGILRLFSSVSFYFRYKKYRKTSTFTI
jgi:MFS family permease